MFCSEREELSLSKYIPVVPLVVQMRRAERLSVDRDVCCVTAIQI